VTGNPCRAASTPAIPLPERGCAAILQLVSASLVRGHLAETIEQTVRLWRRHHLTYDQTKYVVGNPPALERPTSAAQTHG